MKPDEPTLPPPDAPFEFGDRTILALRAQPFAIEHEYGTMISHETTEIPLPVVETAPEIDPIQRLEQKLDAALRLIQSLQQQLDSIDATLARALNR